MSWRNRAAGFDLEDTRRPYQQQWFPGGHGSVGGGGDIRGLSDEGLEWILQGAKDAGLALDTTTVSKIWGIKPDVLVQLENSAELGWSPAEVAMRLLPKDTRDGPTLLHEISRAALVRWAAPANLLPERKRYRPEALKDVAKLIDQAVDFQEWEYTARGGYSDPSASVDDIELADGRRLRRHVVQAGQDLSNVAQIALGDPKRAGEIIDLNRTTLLDPARLYVGQVLNVPAI